MSMPSTAAELQKVLLPDLRELLHAFVQCNSRSSDLPTRFIALRAANLAKEVSSVLTPHKDTRSPEVEAGIRELRLNELLEQRRELSKQIDALDAEERKIKSIDKNA
ncbi:hypothetical protein IVB45_17400 [Bradyrhizobium sp. 4]|uniref:hypothetical protein n=1 Tax=unclassified Bradyrhizobium TaxID=2631580 RepID=UPI001FF7262D|nr:MULTISPECIES: hypothetical protein [unclassified Bradyrhizobium]MCK1402049.1 hypothetical protein [Bradyrhizobium sp. 39]MCK1751231.1 hypothetical protein [Bradyrhizobium sp. 135]UPJ38486.1 hypothetical protein IVB45_17400 [Bradyrhizobium sp. 4]